MDKYLEKLIKDIRKEDVALFIGSGFSLKAGAPSAKDIISAIVSEASTSFLDEIPERERTLRRITEEYIKECGGRNELMCILRKLFTFTPKDTSDQKMLYNIPHFKTIFTTNYDTLIEDFYPKAERVVVTSNEGIPYMENNLPTIYKIHGDINTLNSPDSIIISESDYKNFFTGNKFEMMCQELKHTFSTKHVLFIGYSLEDDNILELIKTVRACVGNSMKGMYLIAPNMGGEKKSKLVKNGVTYIDDYAKNILDKVLDELKSNIHIDYRTKKVSQETFQVFLRRNGNLTTITQHLENENRIKDIQVLEGEVKRVKLKLNLNSETMNEIMENKYNGTIMLGQHLPLPVYKVPTSSINDLSYSINDITFFDKEDGFSVVFAPNCKTIDINLKMDDIHFYETLKAYQYKEGETRHIDFETPICTMKMSLLKDEKTPDRGRINIYIEHNESYKTINDAFKWILFILNMTQGAECYINGIKLSGLKAEQKVLVELKKRKAYYESIKCIEEKLNTTFGIYDKFSDENVEKAMYIYSFLFQQCIEPATSQDELFVFKVDTREEVNRPIEKFRNTNFNMFQCDTIGNLTLNDRTFNIPYRILAFNGCKAKEIKQLDEYRYEIIAEGPPQHHILLCTSELPKKIQALLVH